MIFSEGFELVDFLAKNPLRAKSARSGLPRSLDAARSPHSRARVDPASTSPPLRFGRSRHAQHEDDAARAHRLLPRTRRRSEKNATEADPQRRCRRARRRLRLGQVRRSHRVERCSSARGGHHDTRALGPRRRLPSRSPLDRARIREMPTQHARRGCVTAVLKPPATADPPRSASTETRQALDRRPGDPRREARRRRRCVTGQPPPHPAKRRDRLVPWSLREDKNRRDDRRKRARIRKNGTHEERLCFSQLRASTERRPAPR